MIDSLREVLTSATFWTAIGALAAVGAVLVPYLHGRQKSGETDSVRSGFKRVAAAVITRQGVKRIERVDLPKTMPWPQASQALCAAADAPQDPPRYKLLDVDKTKWIEKPPTVQGLRSASIALVHEDMVGMLQDDPHLVVALLR